MIATDAAQPLYLPPLFTLHRTEGDPFAAACGRAREEGAGALFLSERPGLLAWALVLEPETPLADARRAFLLVMAAAADALAAHCLPERSVRIGWPDTLLYDMGRIGGGRLASPEGSAPAAVPDWLIAGIELIADRDDLAEPGRFPASTSLKEEHFECHGDLVESFARNAMYRLDLWETRGFDAAAEDYLRRLVPEGAATFRIGPTGDLLVRDPASGIEARPLDAALAACAWRDPERGGPRL